MSINHTIIVTKQNSAWILLTKKITSKKFWESKDIFPVNYGQLISNQDNKKFVPQLSHPTKQTIHTQFNQKGVMFILQEDYL